MPQTPTASDNAALPALTTAAVAALLASSCCLLPLALATVGLTGAWLGRLRALQPYSSILTGIAIAALLLAGRTLFQKSNGVSCSVPRRHIISLYKWGFWLTASLTLILLLAPIAAPWFY